MRRITRVMADRARREQGFTLIEVLIAGVVLVIGLVGMAQFFASAGDRVMDSDTRSLLHQTASKEIENIRALPYEDIGTVGGQPSGTLAPLEDMTVESVPVEITREVIYAKDDSYSGPYPANYRRVTVTARATDSPELAPVELSTIIAGGAKGGTLDITVSDLAGSGIPSARLTITNDHLIPHVNISAYAIRTDAGGHLLVPGLTPDATNSYYVTAAKEGYNSAANGEGVVLADGTPYTPVDLIMDQLSSLSIHLTDGAGVAQPDVALTVTGYLSVEPWTFTQEMVTDANGNAHLTNIRYGTSLEPYIIQTSALHDPPLQLPGGIDPDPVDPSITLATGQVGVILDPGTTRSIELVLPPAP